MPTATVNGVDVHYNVLGEDRPGLPLVLTHGFASASAFWRPDVEPLAEKRPLVIYDVRGHGKTTAPDDPESYSLPTLAADLAGLLSEIGIERAHVKLPEMVFRVRRKPHHLVLVLQNFHAQEPRRPRVDPAQRRFHGGLRQACPATVTVDQVNGRADAVAAAVRSEHQARTPVLRIP